MMGTESFWPFVHEGRPYKVEKANNSARNVWTIIAQIRK